MIYQDPLAYLLGLEGIALMDAWAGDHDRGFVDARLAEIRRLDQMPLPDESVDMIVCALALVHVPRLRPVLAEFARVLRPGGDLVISDVHHELVTLGSVIKARGAAGEPYLAATYRHHIGDYLRTALSLGFQVRRCEEPSGARPTGPLPEPATEIGDWGCGRGH